MLTQHPLQQANRHLTHCSHVFHNAAREGDRDTVVPETDVLYSVRRRVCVCVHASLKNDARKDASRGTEVKRVLGRVVDKVGEISDNAFNNS